VDGLIAAAKADVISLTAFEIGLFGWMAIMAFVLCGVRPGRKRDRQERMIRMI
jgi:hypothetical protein